MIQPRARTLPRSRGRSWRSCSTTATWSSSPRAWAVAPAPARRPSSPRYVRTSARSPSASLPNPSRSKATGAAASPTRAPRRSRRRWIPSSRCPMTACSTSRACPGFEFAFLRVFRGQSPLLLSVRTPCLPGCAPWLRSGRRAGCVSAVHFCPGGLRRAAGVAGCCGGGGAGAVDGEPVRGLGAAV